METKNCSVCKISQSLNQFGQYQIAGRDNKNRRTKCHSCRRKIEAQRYLRNPECRNKMKIRAKAHHMKRNYGISIDDYNKMFLQQDGRCAICKEKSGKKLNIDHCHKKNNIRGLLCWACNVGIGHFRENIDSLSAAITYLKGGVI